MTRLAWLKPLFIFTVFLFPLANHANATKHTKILVVGDSLSAAYRLPVEAGWVAMIEPYFQPQDLSQDKSDSASSAPATMPPKSTVSVTNVSISGATTAAGLKILPSALQDHKPDIVILGLGANDGLQGKPLPYIKKNLSRLITMSKDAGAYILLLGIRIPPNYGSAYAEPFFAQYQSLSKEFDTALVPFMLDGVAVNPALMMDDGKHPNAEGQKAVFKVIQPYLEQLIQNVIGA